MRWDNVEQNEKSRGGNVDLNIMKNVGQVQRMVEAHLSKKCTCRMWQAEEVEDVIV